MLAQDISQINSEIFSGLDLEDSKAGDAYMHLCRSFPLRTIHSKVHHKAALAVLEKIMLFLQVHEEQKALCKDVREYLEALATLVEAYERNKYPDAGKGVSGIEMLKYLMEERGVKQTEIAKDLGGQPNASAILNGKRPLNARHIAALAKRFNVSESIFFDK